MLGVVDCDTGPAAPAWTRRSRRCQGGIKRNVPACGKVVTREYHACADIRIAASGNVDNTPASMPPVAGEGTLWLLLEGRAPTDVPTSTARVARLAIPAGRWLTFQALPSAAVANGTRAVFSTDGASVWTVSCYRAARYVDASAGAGHGDPDEGRVRVPRVATAAAAAAVGGATASEAGGEEGRQTAHAQC